MPKKRPIGKKNKRSSVPELVGPRGAELRVDCQANKRFPAERLTTKNKKPKPLGRGAGGIVVGVCGPAADGGCGLAKKIADIRRRNMAIDLDSAARDSYFLKRLSSVRVDGLPVVPRLVDVWYCGGTGRRKTNTAYTVLERFDMNMATLGERRAIDAGIVNEPGTEIGLYKRSELTRMYRIAAKLGMLGIVWSDLKYDQYLYRTSDGLIVGVDFGFAGTIDGYPFRAEQGWPSNQKYPPKFGVCPYEVVPVKTATDAVLFNVWQLQAYLAAAGTDAPTYLQEDDDDSVPRIFIGVQDFWKRPGTSKLSDAVCPGFRSAYDETIHNWRYGRTPVATLTWPDILKDLE